MKTFDIADYSHAKKNHLFGLIEQVEQATNVRKAFINEGADLALKKWHDERPDSIDDKSSMFSHLPDDRIDMIMGHLLKSNPDSKILNAVSKMSVNHQKRAMEYTFHNQAHFYGQKKFLDQWKAVNKTYKSLLKHHPHICNNADDRAGMKRLGIAFYERYGEFTTALKNKDTASIMEHFNSSIQTAYPDDQNDMTVSCYIDTLQGTVAAYLHQPNAFVFGSMLSKLETIDFNLYLFAHEYQHRRQAIAADKYSANSVEQGSTKSIQGRIFNANFQGGYLSPMHIKGRVTQLALYPAYQRQPVEKNADDMAKLMSEAICFDGHKLININRKLAIPFIVVARPIHEISYLGHKIFSKLKRQDASNLNQPSL